MNHPKSIASGQNLRMDSGLVRCDKYAAGKSTDVASISRKKARTIGLLPSEMAFFINTVYAEKIVNARNKPAGGAMPHPTSFHALDQGSQCFRSGTGLLSVANSCTGTA